MRARATCPTRTTANAALTLSVYGVGMRTPDILPIVMQIAAGVGGTVVLAMWPPATGAMLLVPLSADANATARASVAAGALILGSGPLPGSMVVVGDRRRIAARFGWVVITAAPASACGAGAGGRPGAST